MKKVNYEELLEWMRLHKINRKNLAATASSFLNTVISPATIGSYINEGRPMRGEVIMAWQRAYKWTDQETMFFCLNGKPPKYEKEESPKIINIALEDLITLVERKVAQ